MEFNFSPYRLAVLFVLILLFWLFGGFSIPAVAAGGYADSHRIAKAWGYCVVMFVAGAGSVSIVDHYVGNIDRSSIRGLYIVLGVLLMVGSGIWIWVLRQSVEKTGENSEARHPVSLNSAFLVSSTAKQPWVG